MQMEQKPFILHSEYEPMGDQPHATRELVRGFKEGNQFQTLLGVTGSGKTFTMANVIAALNAPTLLISHCERTCHRQLFPHAKASCRTCHRQLLTHAMANKTLAGQLYGEMKEFFPENAVEYFVSYYDNWS